MSYPPKQQTSLLAYESLDVDRLSLAQRRVAMTLAGEGPLTNKGISEALHWPINRVTPRVLELRELGVVRAFDRRPDPVREAVVWRVVDAWAVLL